ncbi:hypothetical protein D3C87_1305180 [compost metagenome]
MKKIYLILSFVLLRIIVFGQAFNPTSHIGAAGSVNTLLGGYTFAYATSGSPWNGAFMSFGGFSNNYDCQISTDYAPHGGHHISFRTRNGDAGIWNSWSELYHNNNINKSDIDFNTKTLYSTNVYNTGNLWSQQIKVALTNPWPDYVFAKDYQLPTLQETEKHIKDKGHLPGIPSATEVKANGIDLGEMNAKLLQKIEELTLHAIEQGKRMDAMQEEIKDLKKNKK